MPVKPVLKKLKKTFKSVKKYFKKNINITIVDIHLISEICYNICKFRGKCV